MEQTIPPPEHLAVIGEELAVRWPDGTEDFIRMDFLRSRSPSAENMGETDLTGRVIYAGDGKTDFSGIGVTGWTVMGGYAIQFQFSDGHNTGLYSFQYLKELGATEDQSINTPD